LVNGSVTFVVPLLTPLRPPAFPEYLFFGTIETVCTVAIIWQAWTWSRIEDAPQHAADNVALVDAAAEV
ncbi:MAG TPA: hypothetical protein VFL13_09855, partial [Candidatus Baltobacteraceae bacterium]|nr:hypothetical protein [Candidatus Baltobacteraceae bacterium]